ncbi:phosphatase PAP2 family protein (plasmid) [Deinococcus metallilatus]|nr:MULTISPECIES: phosphatase PAP2 family protein [Deinococcus]MBB5293659.1 undecaprenyl-diphosphatase [Deinococcus metallilatus]QBY07365.1 phosphatase PAP2 family protein [Deinococcus metallilatus]RXJ14838.1 phosphatase PAP2 family protein [Deinococcus metallilatus]TLK30959.1 phosphatase PAP2 family protein [Deinococcus metallilatus]GMA17589.1 phosphatidylglycerophosphatase B [Deinococcus metallilatus]
MTRGHHHRHLDRLDHLLRTHWRTLLLLFALVLLPLWGFGEIAEQLLQKEPIPFEVPLMLWIHGHASAFQNGVAVTFSLLGSARGMIPIALVLFVVLYRLRHRLAWFALLSLGGVAGLNFVMKQLFERPRPSLWTPALPENDSSFPSGHAMFAAALAATVVVVLWRTRWHWLALVLGVLYVLGMMWSRVYIGVHYPSDVTAGALFSLAWVVALTRVLHPQRALEAGRSQGEEVHASR